MERTRKLLTIIVAAVLMGLVTACDSGSPGTGWERHQEDGGRYFDQGMDCVDAKDETCALEAFEYAIAEYSKAIVLNPGAIKSYYNRGQAHKERGDIYFDLEKDEAATDAYDKAKNDFSQVIDQQPDDRNMLADALYNRGMLHYQDGKYDQAIADFSKAIELMPDDLELSLELYLQRGDTYTEKGETDLAIADFSKAIELAPDNPEAYYLRAQAYEDKGENALALADYEKVLELVAAGKEVPVEVKEFVQKRVEEL
jgi:tetratricopeptide (TPR) repeat protein